MQLLMFSIRISIEQKKWPLRKWNAHSHLKAIHIASFMLVVPIPAIPILPADNAPNDAPWRRLGS